MLITSLLSTTLSLLLIIVMVGIGLSVRLDDLREVWRAPKAIVVGLLAQTLLLPAVAFAICFVAAIPPEFKIGLILLAASPGGPSSNLYSLLASGDVALNLSLTALNNVVSVVTLPLYVMIAIQFFEGGAAESFNVFWKMSEIFGFVILPVLVGMLTARKLPGFSLKLSKYLKVFSVIALTLTVAAIVFANWQILSTNALSFGWVILAFNIFGLALGYVIPKFAGLKKRQAVAIAFEIGIHNGSLALFVAINVLGRQSYAIAPALYSVLMYFTAGAFLLMIRPKPAANERLR